MSLKEMCSLKDCTELRELIIRNPELPLLYMLDKERRKNNVVNRCRQDGCIYRK